MGNCANAKQNDAVEIRLMTSDFYNTKDLNYNITTAKVIKICDGDSIWIAAYCNGVVCRFPCRIYGIDCPELRSTNKLSQLAANRAKEFTMEFCFNKLVKIEVVNGKTVIVDGKELIARDKYGRLLIHLRVNGKDLAEELLKNGLAILYYGKHKNSFSSNSAPASDSTIS